MGESEEDQSRQRRLPPLSDKLVLTQYGPYPSEGECIAFMEAQKGEPYMEGGRSYDLRMDLGDGPGQHSRLRLRSRGSL